jgi:FdhD protein
MRTPGHDEELAAGFLLSEGIVRRREDVLRVEPCGRSEEGNVVNVLLAPEVFVDFDRLTRHVFASSSCGLCGKATIDAIRALFPAAGAGQRVTPRSGADSRAAGAGAGEDPARVCIDGATLASLPEKMLAAQATFARTGGLHAAALFDLAGNLLVLREDVGRHNAVDKVLGHALLGSPAAGGPGPGPGAPPLPLDRHVLLVSGRSSFEIMQKALAGRVPIVAAVSAPSSLAVSFAAESGQTLVGFLRGGRMNVYAHAHRIRFG